MSTKAILFLCAQVLLIQSTVSQCARRAAIDAYGLGAPYGRAAAGRAPAMAGPALAYDGLAAGRSGRGLACDGPYAPAIEFTATSGGALPVTSTSAIAPTGISVVSENAIEGILSVAGELPFVGSTGMEGALVTAGAGAINHACGNGLTAMTSELAIAPTAVYAPTAAIAPTTATFGPAPYAGRIGLGGCGRDVIY